MPRSPRIRRQLAAGEPRDVGSIAVWAYPVHRSTESDHRVRIISARNATRPDNDSTTQPNEPSAASLEEMPEISEPRFRRRPGRGHHAGRSVTDIVVIDAELWSHFGSADAVNDALRYVIAERKTVAGS